MAGPLSTGDASHNCEPKQLNSKPCNSAVDNKRLCVEEQWNKNQSNTLTQCKVLSSISETLELHIPDFKKVLTTLF